jgi:hypothetical protein
MVANLLLGVWLILVGVTWLDWVSVDTKVLGLLAFITGLVLLVVEALPHLEKRP